MENAANTVPEVRLNQVRVGTITNLPNDRNLIVFDEEYGSDGGSARVEHEFLR